MRQIAILFARIAESAARPAIVSDVQAARNLTSLLADYPENVQRTSLISNYRATHLSLAGTNSVQHIDAVIQCCGDFFQLSGL